MRTRTLTNLLADVRQIADVVGATARHSDAQITKNLNRAAAFLQDQAIDAGQDYYLDDDTITTASGTSDYNLPSDYYKTRGVDVVVSGSTIECQLFNFGHRNRYQYQNGWQTGYPIAYRALETSLRLLPTPTAVYTVTHYYHRTAGRLDTGTPSGTVDIINGSGEKYMLYDAAVDIMLRDRKPVTELVGLRDAALLAFMTNISSRNTDEPERLRRIRPRPWTISRRDP